MTIPLAIRLSFIDFPASLVLTGIFIIGSIIWAGIYFLASRWIPYFVPALYWSLAVVAASFLIFYFFRDTRYEIFGLNLIGYLELVNLLVFCVWFLNILARALNIIPFIFGRELWVGYLASGSCMFAFFWAFFVFL